MSTLPDLPLRRIDALWHVGDFERRTTRTSTSYEGSCLSVSRHPEDWTGIAGLGGFPVWKLEREGAQWIDVHEIDGPTFDAIEAWAVAAGLVECVPLWTVVRDDEESGELRFSFLDRAAAYEEAGIDEGLWAGMRGLRWSGGPSSPAFAKILSSKRAHARSACRPGGMDQPKRFCRDSPF